MGLHMFPAHGVANDAFRDNPALVPLDESPVAYAQQEHGWVAVETSQACDPNQAPELAQASQEGDVGLASSSAVPDPESGERVVDRKAASKVQDSTQMEDQGVDPGCASPDFTSATLAAPDAKPNNAKYRPEVYEDDLSSWIAWKKLAQARLLHLSPAWFSVTMGTGMLGNLFLLAPWQDVHAVLRWPGTVLIVFNCMLCVSLPMYIVPFLTRSQQLPALHAHDAFALRHLPLGPEAHTDPFTAILVPRHTGHE